MFDHMKRVVDWTIMVCHVYDHVYCKVLTIAVVICSLKALKLNDLCGQNLMK